MTDVPRMPDYARALAALAIGAACGCSSAHIVDPMPDTGSRLDAGDTVDAPSPRDTGTGPSDGGSDAATGPDDSAVGPRQCDPRARFTSILPLTELGSASNEGGMRLSSDGLTAYFESDRSGGAGSWDVWTATRATTASAFDPPRSVLLVEGVGLTTGTRGEVLPAVTPDELVLYFAAPGPAGAHDVYLATRDSVAEPFDEAVVVEELATGAFDYPTWISADRCVLYVSRYAGGSDLWVATRTP